MHVQTSVRLSRLARQATAGFATELTPLHDHLALTRVSSVLHCSCMYMKLRSLPDGARRTFGIMVDTAVSQKGHCQLWACADVLEWVNTS